MSGAGHSSATVAHARRARGLSQRIRNRLGQANALDLLGRLQTLSRVQQAAGDLMPATDNPPAARQLPWVRQA